MGIRTSRLSANQVSSEVPFIGRFLKDLGVLEITARYGFSCHTSHTYEPIPIGVDKIEEFIRTSIQEGIYALGDDELLLESEVAQVLFILCHEGDIHFESQRVELVGQVQDHWQQRGFESFMYPDEKKDVGL